MSMIAGKKIVLVVTGGIATYKTLILARLLIKAQAEIRVVMTHAATEFVTPKTFSVLTQYDVLTDLFSGQTQADISHIELADWANYMLVVPATANFMAKMVQGIADDAASSVVIARHTPIAIAPAMNLNMYQNPAVVRNIEQLKADGVHIIEPVVGDLAEGYQGKGRLPEPEDLYAQIEVLMERDLGTPVLTGKRVLISAGGTKEAIDPVRYIANRSSGKMGYALAQAAVQAGAQVDLVSTVQLPAPMFTNVIAVETANQMLAAMKDHFEQADIVIMAAAVADYRVANPANQKIKKDPVQKGLTLNLVENPDILAQLGAKKTHQYLVGFAAETQNLLEHAQAKLIKKQADLLIANDVSNHDIAFGSDNNEVTLLSKNDAPKHLALTDKLTLSHQILEIIAARMEE